MDTTSTRGLIESLESRRLFTIGFGWGLGGGGTEMSSGDAVVVDTDGSVFVAGHFSGTLDVDPTKNQSILTAAGTSDMFVIKYSADRKLLWAKRFGGASQQVFPTAMATDPNGFLYIVGSFTGSGDVGTSHGGEDAFIFELYSSDGHGLAHSFFGGPGYDAARTVDGSHGDPLIGGVFSKTASFAQAGTLTSAGGKDGFVIRYLYDADVNSVWQIGGAGDDVINQLVYNTFNVISVVGTMQGTAYFGKSKTIKDSNGHAAPVYLNSHGGKDAFYARYTDGFRNAYAQRYGGKGDDFGDSLAEGFSGTYIAGTFVKPMEGLVSTGGRDIFVKQINGSIAHIGSAADDAMGKLAINNRGLVVTGMYGAPFSFNGTTLEPEGFSDVFFATYDNNFRQGEIASIGGIFADTTTSLALGPGGAACFTGSFQRGMDLGPGKITAQIYGTAAGQFWLDRFILT